MEVIMNTVAEAATTVQFHDTTWRDTVQRVSAMAQARLPEALHGRIQRATGLVLGGGVWVEEDGHTCQVRASDGQTWYSANGSCPCEDHQRAPERLCKHRLARGLYLRAAEVLRTGSLPPPGGVEDTTAAVSPEVPAADLDPRFIAFLHGRPFVKYAGLLAKAHEAGLVKLEARIEFHSDSLVLASCTATFSDGRVCTEWADATPENVGMQVRPHWIRMALTRAKARALRDALNIGMCAVEEMNE
jgi:hypothetical protein